MILTNEDLGIASFNCVQGLMKLGLTATEAYKFSENLYHELGYDGFVKVFEDDKFLKMFENE